MAQCHIFPAVAAAYLVSVRSRGYFSQRSRPSLRNVSGSIRTLSVSVAFQTMFRGFSTEYLGQWGMFWSGRSVPDSFLTWVAKDNQKKGTYP